MYQIRLTFLFLSFKEKKEETLSIEDSGEKEFFAIDSK